MYRVSQGLSPAQLTLLKIYKTLGFKCVQSIFHYHFIRAIIAIYAPRALQR
jgi:hypothetical protein